MAATAGGPSCYGALERAELLGSRPPFEAGYGALIVSCSGLPAVVGVEHAPSHPGRAADPCQRDRRDGYVEVLATT